MEGFYLAPSMYWLLKIFLFRMDPEKAHYFTMWCFMALLKVPGLKWLLKSIYQPSKPQLGKTVVGLQEVDGSAIDGTPLTGGGVPG